MFVIPPDCAAYGLAFPPVGTRVNFEVSTSKKTGRPTAVNVRPGLSGTMYQVKEKFGFIKQDSGEPDMFVIPQSCPYYDSQFPPVGTRVIYEVTTSQKSGRVIADDVQPMFKDSGEVRPVAAAQPGGLLALPAPNRPAGLNPQLA